MIILSSVLTYGHKQFCLQKRNNLSCHVFILLHFLTIDSVISNSPNQSSTPLDSAVAKRALVQCTDTIIESNIDPFTLVRKLYSREIIPQDVYKRVKDKDTRDSAEDRRDKILDYLTDRIEHDVSIFTSFLSVLRELGRDDLADIIMTKYFRLVAFV